MTSIYLYKRDAGNYTSWRYEISNIERLDVQLNAPVTAMPLPMESREENILVKMEGNSEVCQMTWRIPQESIVRVKTKTGTLSSAITQKLANDDARTVWNGSTYGAGAFAWQTVDSDLPVLGTSGEKTGSDIINFLISKFEGIDIEDEFYLAIPEMDAREGWLSQLNATISGDSPVVWTVSATFLTGRVISVYDMDSPSEPRDITVLQTDSSGNTGNVDTSLRIRWVNPVETGGSSITHYTLYVKTSSSGWMEFRKDTVANFTSGGNLQYILTAGATDEEHIFKVTATNADEAEGMYSDPVFGIFP